MNTRLKLLLAGGIIAILVSSAIVVNQQRPKMIAPESPNTISWKEFNNGYERQEQARKAAAAKLAAPPKTERSIEELMKAAPEKLTEEERQRVIHWMVEDHKKGLSPKERAKLEKEEKETEFAQAVNEEVCNIVVANLHDVDDCNSNYLENNKVRLFVKYQYREGFTNDERHPGFQLYEVLSKLYNSPYRFKRVKIIASAELTDGYGYTANRPWATVILEEEQAYKINWKVEPVMLTEYLPNVWELTGPITYKKL